MSLWRRLKPVEKAEYMLVNVGTVRPSTDQSVQEMMKEYGIEPKNVRHETLPIRARYRHVFYFRVGTEEEKTKIDRRIDGMKWEKEFDVEKLCEEENTPFLYHSLPLAEIVEACFLATLKPEEKRYDDLEYLLNTKRHMAKVKKDVVERILKFLSNTGRKIYRQEVHPYTWLNVLNFLKCIVLFIVVLF